MSCKTYDLLVKVQPWVALRSCEGDGGRPSGIGMQVQIPNHLKQLWSKVTVVSVEEKAHEMRQV
jgi:hypothetical protein